MRPNALFRLLPLLVLAACGNDGIFGAGAPVTTLSPAPGPFNDKVSVTFATNMPATVYVTTDGSDPRNETGTRVSGEAPFKLELAKTTTVTFYSSDGADEAVRSVQYVRAGGAKGTIKGTIVVGSVALGREIGLLAGGAVQRFPALTSEGEIPFAIEGVETGRYRVQAIADRNDDGNFVPVADLSSDAYTAEIDLGDPFKASVENVRLFLGASDEGLCSIVGTVTVPNAQVGEAVRLSILSPDAFTQAAQDPGGLLTQLQQGDQLFLSPDADKYPYAVTNLEPGSYLPVPALTNFALGGIGLHFMGNPLNTVRCNAGKTVKRDFTFGPLAVSGSVTVDKPQGQGGGPLGNFSIGVLAARRLDLMDGIDAVLMPVVLLPDGDQPGKLRGNYSGQGMKASATYQAKFFTGLGQDGILSALTWVLVPFGGSSSGGIDLVFGQADLQRDLDLSTPAPPPAPAP
jgi:hypothetical protein